MVNHSNPIELSDALRWLYTELEHIRRIHFVVTVIASLAILICVGAQPSSGVYEDLQKLSYYVQQSTIAWREIIADNISKYHPEWVPHQHDPFFESIPQEEVVTVIDKSESKPNKPSLFKLRHNFEHVGVTVRLIDEVSIDNKAISDYREWKSKGLKKNLIQDARITSWPTSEESGKIEYSAMSGKLFYHGSAVFFTRFENWSAPENWFKKTFPSLENNWVDYGELNMDDALKKATKDLLKDLPNISLSLGIQVPKKDTVVAFPILILLSLIVLAVQVSYVAEFAIFCETKWQTPACFLAPWIGGQPWPRCKLLRLLQFECTILFIPVVAVGLLSLNFHIYYGYWRSIGFGAIFGISYFILYKRIKKGAACIAKLNFQNEGSHEHPKIDIVPPPTSSSSSTES